MVTLQELKKRLPKPGHVIAQRYVLVAPLDRGGFGLLWSADDQATNRRVALKFLARKDQDAAITNLKHEFTVLSGLAHPHVIAPFNFDHDANLGNFYTLPLLDALPLHKACHGQSVAYVEGLLVQVLRALAYVHSQGILHGDIKPQNLLVEHAATDQPHMRLIDFGLARTQVDTQGEGTLGYMAPEMFLGLPVDSRADLYAVGVVFYQALSGSNPFFDIDATHAQHKHCQLIPPSLREARAEVPAYLDDIIMRLLAKTPDQRYATARHVLQELKLLSPAHYPLEDAYTQVTYIPGGATFLGQREVRNAVHNCLTSDTAVRLCISGDGGFGKSTCASFVRCQAALHDYRVLHIDGPSDTVIPHITTALSEALTDPAQRLVCVIDDAPAVLEAETQLTQLLQLVCAAQGRHHHVILTCRTAHALPSGIIDDSWQHARLREFSVNDIIAYLSQAVTMSDNALRPLAEQLFAKTDGIPALVAATVIQLLQREFLVDGGGAWTEEQLHDISIDLDTIDPPSALLDDVRTRLATLPSIAQAALRWLTLSETPLDAIVLTQLDPQYEQTAWDQCLRELFATGWIGYDPRTGAYDCSDGSLTAAMQSSLDTETKQHHYAQLLDYARTQHQDEAICDHYHMRCAPSDDAFAALLRMCARLDREGQPGRALALLEGWKNHRSEQQDFAWAQAYAYHAISADRCDEGIAQIINALDSCPDPHQSTQLHCQLIQLHLRKRDWPAATAAMSNAQHHLSTAHTDDPALPIILANLEAQCDLGTNNIQDALEIFQCTATQAQQLPLDTQQRIDNNDAAACYLQLGDTQAALTILQDIVEHERCAPESRRMAKVLYHLGTALQQSEQVSAAYETYERGMQIAHNLHDIKLLVAFYNALGIVARELERISESCTWFARALPLAYRVSDLSSACALSINHARLLLRQNCAAQAQLQLDTFEKILNSNISIPNAEIQRCVIFHLQGEAARQQHNFVKALTTLAKAWEIATVTNLTKFRAPIALTTAEVFFDQQKNTDAHTWIERAEAAPHDQAMARAIISLREQIETRQP